MGTAVGTFSARTNHRIRLETQLASQSIPGNSSVVNWQLYAEKTSSSTSYYLTNGGGGTVTINGTPYTVPAWQYDFRSQTTILLASGSTTIIHNSDGTKTYAFSASVTAPGSLGSASCSGTQALTTIARATQPTVSPASGDTGTSFSIGVVAASSAFFHDIDYSVDGGATYTSIVANLAGTTTSQSWTPPSTLLPSAASVTAIIKVTTHASSGGTVIGTKTVSLPLTVPSTVIPTISSVAWVDTQTSSPDIPTMMGGTGRYVQGWSKLQPTVTAAGAGGSTVTGSQVTLNGQVTASGAAFGLPVNLSGSVPFSAIATDSRGRTSDPYVNTVPVTAYNFPNLPTPAVQRTSDAAGLVPSPTGTYLCITPLASVSDLTFGGVQKNLLEWQVRIKPVGGSFTTVQAWTNATVSGNTWTTKYVAAGPYASSTAYVVEVSIRDVFGKNGFNTANTVKVLTVNVPSEFVFMDYDGNDGLGLGKYRTNGFLDVGGDIYQNGLPVVDFGDAATTSLPGLAQLATDAEAIAGTNTAKAVTPHAFAAGLASSFIARNRNRIINGNFRVNQRGYVSAASLASGVYGFDRWASTAAGTTVTFTSAPQGQTVTVNASHGIKQTVERANILAGAYVLSWTGTATARVYNVGATPPSLAASPVLVTLDGLADVVVEFGGGTIGMVQLEQGSLPTPYEQIALGDELSACKRYYYQFAVNDLPVQNPYWNVALANGAQIMNQLHPVPMRVAPTIDNAGAGGALNVFAYYNYSAGAVGNYTLSLAASATEITAASYASTNNGGVSLPVGRTMGVNALAIYVSAEF